MNCNNRILSGETAYNRVFVVRCAHSNAVGTSQTRGTLYKIPNPFQEFKNFFKQ
jgi:hypothetical protein